MEYGQIFHVTRTGNYYCKNMKYKIKFVEYGQIFHVTRTGKYYCKNMKYRINIFILYFIFLQ